MKRTLFFVVCHGRGGSYDTIAWLHQKHPWIRARHECITIPELDYQMIKKWYFYIPRVKSYILEIDPIYGWDASYWPVIRQSLRNFVDDPQSWEPILGDAGPFLANHLDAIWDEFSDEFEIRIVVLEREAFKYSFLRRGVDIRVRETVDIPFVTRIMENFNQIFPLSEAETPLEALENFAKAFEEKISLFEEKHKGVVLRIKTEDLDSTDAQDKIYDHIRYPALGKTDRCYKLPQRKRGNADSNIINILGRTAQWTISKDNAWPPPWKTNTN